MVDALSSGGSECMLVGVQLPPLARMEKPRKTLERQHSGVFSYMPGSWVLGTRRGVLDFGFWSVWSRLTWVWDSSRSAPVPCPGPPSSPLSSRETN